MSNNEPTALRPSGYYLFIDPSVETDDGEIKPGVQGMVAFASSSKAPLDRGKVVFKMIFPQPTFLLNVH